LLDLRYSKFNEIDGVYDFQCKTPEIYDLGVSVDKKILISPFNDNELAKTFIPEFNFHYELFIDGKSLGLNFVEKPINLSYYKEDIGYYAAITFAKIEVPKCKQIKLVITKSKGGLDFSIQKRIEE
jgi:hypothetical protein